jgi:hypothetical protein
VPPSSINHLGDLHKNCTLADSAAHWRTLQSNHPIIEAKIDELRAEKSALRNALDGI